MKHLPAAPILLALVCLATISAASAQHLPSSMAYSASVIVRAPADGTQKLLVTGNSLVSDPPLGLDLSQIPASPGNHVRRVSAPTAAQSGQSMDAMRIDQSVATGERDADTTISKQVRSAVLLAIMAIVYLATRKRPKYRKHGDISELRNFPKNRLAHRVTGA